MKKNIIHLMSAGLALLSGLAVASCNNQDIVDANDVLVVKSVLPTKVIEGQIVTITGTGLEKATSVVFPGNISVSEITKVGNGYISVTTPAGVSADGGKVTVEADDESAESAMTLTVGNPQPLRVAPLDKEIKIGECLEVYGSDLEFITRAYFPGDDGNDIAVDANVFRRKSTGSLYIYSPAGVKAGAAQVVLEDCSGKKYTLPEVTLSDELSDGEDAEYVQIWSGEQVTGWWWYLSASDLDLSGITPAAGQTIRFTFAHHDAPQTFCLCDGWWGAPFIREGGESDNNIVLAAGEDILEFEISEGMATTMNGTDTSLIIGGDITVTQIEIRVD